MKNEHYSRENVWMSFIRSDQMIYVLWRSDLSTLLAFLSEVNVRDATSWVMSSKIFIFPRSTDNNIHPRTMSFFTLLIPKPLSQFLYRRNECSCNRQWWLSWWLSWWLWWWLGWWLGWWLSWWLSWWLMMVTLFHHSFHPLTTGMLDKSWFSAYSQP